MNANVPVSEIMTRNLITAKASDSLRSINNLFRDHQIRHLPIVSGDKLVGIISKTDLLRLSFGDLYDDQQAADETVFDLLSTEHVMVNQPITVQAKESIKAVAEKMSQVEFHALPVLDEDKIVGIVSTTDLIKYLLQQYA